MLEFYLAAAVWFIALSVVAFVSEKEFPSGSTPGIILLSVLLGIFTVATVQ